MGAFDIKKLPSRGNFRLVQAMNATEVNPEVIISWDPLQSPGPFVHVDNDPDNDIFLDEFPLVIDARNLPLTEEVWLVDGVDNDDNTATYTAEVRGVSPSNIANPPVEGFLRYYRAHATDVFCAVDETWLTRVLKDLFLQGTTEDQGEAGEDIGNIQPVSVHSDGKIYIYDSINYPNFAGISTSEVETGNTINFITPGGVSIGHVGLTPGANEFAEDAIVVPIAAVAALQPGAGNIDDGDHDYKIVFKNSTGITIGGAVSNSVEVVDKTVDGQIELTSVEVSSDDRVAERDIYRRFDGAGAYKYVGTIPNNTVTTFTDNVANSSLGANLVTIQTISGITEQISNTTVIMGHARPDGTSIRLFGAPATELELATTQEAEEGTDDIKYMSPLKVRQAMVALAPELLAGAFSMTGTRATSVSPRVLRWTDILNDGVYEVRRSVSKPNPIAITSVADYDGTEPGTVLITAAGHNLTTGDIIDIFETGRYEGEHRVTVVNATTFYIDHEWSSTATGEFYLLFGFLTSTTEDITTYIDNEPVEGTVQYIITARTDDDIEKSTDILTFLGSTLLTFTGTYFGDGSDGAYAGGDLERGVIHQFTSFNLNAPMNFTGTGLAIIFVDGNVTLGASAVLNSVLTVVPEAAFGEGTVQGNPFDIGGGRGADGIKGSGGGGGRCYNYSGSWAAGGGGGAGGIAGNNGATGGTGQHYATGSAPGGAGGIAPGGNGGQGASAPGAGGGGAGASGGLPFLHDGILFIISGDFDDQAGSEWVGQGADSSNAGNGAVGGNAQSQPTRAAGGGGGGGSGPGGGDGVKIHVFHLGTKTELSIVDGDPGDGGNGGSGAAGGSSTGVCDQTLSPATAGAAGQAGAQGATGNILFTQLV